MVAGTLPPDARANCIKPGPGQPCDINPGGSEGGVEHGFHKERCSHETHKSMNGPDPLLYKIGYRKPANCLCSADNLTEERYSLVVTGAASLACSLFHGKGGGESASGCVTGSLDGAANAATVDFTWDENGEMDKA